MDIDSSRNRLGMPRRGAITYDRCRRHEHTAGTLLLIALLLCLSPPATPQGPAAGVDARRVEAAFLRNFAHYITWPEASFADPQSPWHICVIGNDPFGDVLEKTFEGRTEQGRAFTIIRSKRVTKQQHCHIAYLAYKVSANRRAALNHLKALPVLTVSSAPGFLQEGGIIGFNVSEHVELNVNLDQARSASLSIQTKVLEVSRSIIENGIENRLR